MKRLISIHLLLVLAWAAVCCKSKDWVPTAIQPIEQETDRVWATFSTEGLSMAIDENGYVAMLMAENKDVLLKSDCPIVVACRNGRIALPQRVERMGNDLNVVLDDGGEVQLGVSEKADYLKMVVLDAGVYEALVLCPFAVKVDEIVGEVVGVLQGRGLAFGMQALNDKTNAGLPQDYAEALHERFAYDGEAVVVSVGTIPSDRLAATRVENGARMQFSARDRSRDGQHTVQGVEGCAVQAVEGDDGRIEGAALALFACPKAETMHRVSSIEMSENLPHPTLDGVWSKTSRAAVKSYFIADFSSADLDLALEKCRRAGIEQLYLDDPFSKWGHFVWSQRVVKGDEEMRSMAERARDCGVHLGIHVFSNLITTNDAYVVPRFSEHLLKQGRVELQADIAANQTDLAVYASGLFAKPMTLNVLQVGEELVTYRTTEVSGHVNLLHNCTRGAFGTKASAHKKGETVYKLWDHPLGTLMADITLQDEMTDRIVELVNNTGISLLSFDGLEACAFTGHGDFAMARCVSRCHEAWEHEVLNDASWLTHNNWHVHSRMNWGEPCSLSVRHGQIETRIANQDFFRRNLLPGMLGTFRMNLSERELECTSLEDVEWAMSKTAGCDAGLGLSVKMNVFRNHGRINEIMDALNAWETLRMANAFSESQKALLRDPYTEWHLEKASDSLYRLYQMHVSRRLRCDIVDGFNGAEWKWDNPCPGPCALRLSVSGKGSISNPSIRTSQGMALFHCVLKPGQYLLLDFTGEAYVTDQNYNVIESVVVEGDSRLPEGDTTISFDCEKNGKGSTEVTLRVMTRELNAEVRHDAGK